MPPPATTPIVRPRVCFLGYRHIAQLAAPVFAEYAHRAEIEVVEAAFDPALAHARERIRNGTADVFMSAGANGAILRKNLAAPVAIIQLDGFSLLQALLKARSISARVGVVMYGRTIPELDDIKAILNLEVAQYAYDTTDDARQCCERLRQDGFDVIVGSSVVVEIAEGQGLHGLLAYSLNGVRRGLDDAIELARVSRLESGRYQQLNGVLGNLQEAVLAVDRRHKMIAINPRMQQLLSNSGGSLLGKRLDTIAPELSLEHTMDSGAEQRAAVLRFARRDWIVNRTPIREYGEIVGAALTLYDAQVIAEADTSLRIQQRKRQAAARYSFDDLIGNSPPFLRAITTARRFANTDLTVLIAGESGSGSIARRFPRPCWRASCSAMKRAPSPAPGVAASAACSSRPTPAPCSSMKSAICRCRCKPACCACCRSARSSGSGASPPFRSTCG
jgi:propionate catabolism operon transcriptional regulator